VSDVKNIKKSPHRIKGKCVASLKFIILCNITYVLIERAGQVCIFHDPHRRAGIQVIEKYMQLI